MPPCGSAARVTVLPPGLMTMVGAPGVIPATYLCRALPWASNAEAAAGNASASSAVMRAIRAIDTQSDTRSARMSHMPKATKMMAAGYGEPDQVQPYEVDVPEAGPGEVTIDVRAAGVNPADYKAGAGNRGRAGATLPLPIGFEVAGVVSAAGPDTGFTAGDEVLAFRVRDGYI